MRRAYILATASLYHPYTSYKSTIVSHLRHDQAFVHVALRVLLAELAFDTGGEFKVDVGLVVLPDNVYTNS